MEIIFSLQSGVQPVVILFAKAPIPGRVKTRLLSRLSPSQAASLHIAFVNDLLERFLHNEFTVELHTDTGTDAWKQFEVTQRIQHEGHLGLKMLHALDEALSRGAPQAAIVGTDAPTLPVAHVSKMLSLPTDIGLGPAEDGGYYCVSAKRTHPAMFDGVVWGSRDAMQETLAACEQCGLTAALGPVWFDVDEPADLDRLFSLADLPRHTKKWMRDNCLERGAASLI